MGKGIADVPEGAEVQIRPAAYQLEGKREADTGGEALKRSPILEQNILNFRLRAHYPFNNHAKEQIEIGGCHDDRPPWGLAFYFGHRVNIVGCWQFNMPPSNFDFLAHRLGPDD